MIKKLSIFAFMAFAVSTPAKAADISESEVKTCEMLGSAANAVMTARQNSTSPIYIRDRLKAILVKHDMVYIMPMIDTYITDAYEQSAYSTEKMKNWAINSFQSDKEADCLRYFFEKEKA